MTRETLSQNITPNFKELGQKKSIIDRQGTIYHLKNQSIKQTTATQAPADS